MKFLKKVFGLGKDEGYEEAIELYNNHMYRKAIERFKKVIENKDPSISLHHRLSRFYCGQAHYNLGVTFFAMSNFDKAVVEFENALKFRPNQVEIWEYLGICYNNICEYEKAVNAFEKVLDAEPSHLPARLKLGIAFHNLQMWDKAISICQEILKTHPNYADVYFHLGLAYLGQGNPSDASLAFENALKINPRYKESRIRLGITQAYLGNLDEALNHISLMLKEFPNYSDLHYYLGIIYASSDEIPKAISSFRRALEINPLFSESRVKLAIILYKAKKFNEALNEIEEANRLDPGNKKIHMILDHLRRQISLSEKVSKEMPGITHMDLTDDEIIAQNIHDFNKHLEIVPNFSEMLSIMKGFSEENVSFYEPLISIVQDSVAQHPGYADLHCSLGSLFFKTKRYDEAEKAFKQALAINPEYLQARINLFRTFKVEGKLEAALKEGQYLFEKGLPYPDFHCSLGEIYISLKMFDEAEAVLQSALEKKPTYSRAYLVLAQLYENMGAKDKAISQLLKCLDSNPSKEHKLEASEALLRLRGSEFI
jgi:tetratricopeptide (TPR) repeat protein